MPPASTSDRASLPPKRPPPIPWHQIADTFVNSNVPFTSPGGYRNVAHPDEDDRIFQAPSRRRYTKHRSNDCDAMVIAAVATATATATRTRWREQQQQLLRDGTFIPAALATVASPISLSLGHTAGLVLELSRTFGARTLTTGQTNPIQPPDQACSPGTCVFKAPVGVATTIATPALPQPNSAPSCHHCLVRRGDTERAGAPRVRSSTSPLPTP